MQNRRISPFAIFYTVFAVSFLVLAGCRDAKNQNSFKNSDLPLESCAKSLSSLQPKSESSRIRSTDLTSGQYDYSSGEIFVELPFDPSRPSRAHAIESVQRLENGTYSVSVRLLCKEGIDAGAKESFVAETVAPRTLRVNTSQTTIDTAFRGSAVQSVEGSISYHFKDSLPNLMGLSRTALESHLSQLFDEQYFTVPSSGVFQFIGKKKIEGGKGTLMRASRL